MSLKPHIRRAFLEDITITQEDLAIGSVQRADGTEWGIILDQEIIEALEQHPEILCIGSFQLWYDGMQIVVLRLHRKNGSKR